MTQMSYFFHRHSCSLCLLFTEGLHDFGYHSYLLRSADLFLIYLPWTWSPWRCLICFVSCVEKKVNISPLSIPAAIFTILQTSHQSIYFTDFCLYLVTSHTEFIPACDQLCCISDFFLPVLQYFFEVREPEFHAVSKMQTNNRSPWRHNNTLLCLLLFSSCLITPGLAFDHWPFIKLS